MADISKLNELWKSHFGAFQFQHFLFPDPPRRGGLVRGLLVDIVGYSIQNLLPASILLKPLFIVFSLVNIGYTWVYHFCLINGSRTETF